MIKSQIGRYRIRGYGNQQGHCRIISDIAFRKRDLGGLPGA